MVATQTAVGAASRARLIRYWTSHNRDYNGRLGGDLRIRIEWIDAKGIYTSCGTYFADDHAINWEYDEPPASVAAQACNCALDAGEYTETDGATYEGIESGEQMCTRVELEAA